MIQIRRTFTYLSEYERDFLFLVFCAVVSFPLNISVCYGFCGAAGYAASRVGWRQRWRIMHGEEPWRIQVKKGIISINEARRKMGFGPLPEDVEAVK